jgi:glycerol-3-phosphate dehydrogenase
LAVEADDENYAAAFPNMCARCGISTEALDTKEVRDLEPALSDKLTAAYLADDASPSLRSDSLLKTYLTR